MPFGAAQTASPGIKVSLSSYGYASTLPETAIGVFSNSVSPTANPKVSEIIFAPRLKTPENYKHSQIQTLDKKMYTIYKARSTLKDRIILNRTGSDFFKQEFEPYIPLEKNTKLSGFRKIMSKIYIQHLLKKEMDLKLEKLVCPIVQKFKSQTLK